MFYSIHYKNDCLSASDLFICLHNQLSSIYPLSRIKEYRCWKNLIHQIDSKNEWLHVSASFTAKFWLAFVLTLENAFS